MDDHPNKPMNGQDADAAAIRDIRRLQAGEPEELLQGIADLVKHTESRARPMTMADVAQPFSQRDHDLLLQSVDRVAHDWVTQLQNVRHNSEALEQMVLSRATRLKAELTQLFLLGHAVTVEAKRGDDVNAKLTEEISKLAEEQAA